jgi:hypothetical protein
MTRKRSARSNEADVNHDREKLTSAFESLLSRSTIDMLTREAMGLLRSNADVYRHAASTAVRRNPLAVAVAGIGLAWLFLGKGQPDDEQEVVEDHRPRSRTVAAMVRNRMDDDRWSDSLDRLRRTASSRLRTLEEDARTTYDGLRDDVTDSAADARDYMSERASVLADLADGMKRRFAHGLDDLSTSAREGIVAAREEAYATRLRAEDALGRGGREAKRIVEDHPMVAGAVALALGAALGAVLSRNRSADAGGDLEDDLEHDPEDDFDEADDDALEDFPKTLEDAQQSWRDRKAAKGRRARK